MAIFVFVMGVGVFVVRVLAGARRCGSRWEIYTEMRWAGKRGFAPRIGGKCLVGSDGYISRNHVTCGSWNDRSCG
jgi:hypothetical protein